MHATCNNTYRNIHRNVVCQNISRSILEVNFISRLQKYIWSTASFQQAKILVDA